MYIPKNLTKTDLYTAGNEFVFAANGKPYKGYYWKDFRGKFYSGVNPEDIPFFEIVPPPPVINNSTFEDNTEVMRTIQNNINLEGPYNANAVVNYSNLKSNPIPNPMVPQPYFPQPTPENYGIKEFQRYFCKKTNELTYLEVTKDTYEKISNRDDNWLWQLYFPFTLPWKIRGFRFLTYVTNRNIVMLKSSRFKLKGFINYLRSDFLKYYKYPPQSNIYTSGGELVTIKGKNYIGYYHINAEMGPMIGKYHESIPHNRLLFIDTLGAAKFRSLDPNLKNKYIKKKSSSPNGGTSY